MRFRDSLALGEVMAWIYLRHALSRAVFGRVLVLSFPQRDGEYGLAKAGCPSQEALAGFSFFRST